MCAHHDFEDDDLTDLFGASPAVSDADAAFVLAHLSKGKPVPQQGTPVYEEPCPKCKGSGRFISYSGRTVGNCFHCKGTGKVTFKTSPEARAKSKEQRDAVAARKQAELMAKVVAWEEEHEAESKWMTAAVGRGFEFAISLMEALHKWGSLTDNQLAAVRRCMAKDDERAREREEIAKRAPDVSQAALSRIHDAFNAAIANDVKFPKLRLDAFIFSLVRSGQNAGAIYVKSIEKDDMGERRYLGKIAEGRFFKAFKTTEEEQAQIIAAAGDPEAAAIAYGRRVGACSICGRGLTNHASIDRGIGPICAEKFGW